MVHRRFRHRHGRHGRREFLNMFKTVAQRSPRRLVAQRRQKGGTSIAVVAEWRHKHCRGCRMEAQWSPNGRQVIDAFCCKFSRQSGRCFCLPCRWSSYTETGFSGVRRPLSVLAIFWSFKGGTKVAILCEGGISDIVAALIDYAVLSNFRSPTHGVGLTRRAFLWMYTTTSANQFTL